jgi:tRNA guanosine-2'-O-methyltransferase
VLATPRLACITIITIIIIIIIIIIIMDTTILDLLGEQVKIQAFKACLTKLNTAPQLDLDALRACIKIWPSLQPTLEDRHNDVLSGDLVDAHKDQDQSKGLSQATESYPLVESFCELLVAQIPHEHIDSNRFYALAEILCSDASFANMLFREKIYPDLVTLLPLLSERVPRDVDESDQATGIVRQSVSKAIAYLTLLKCSYWLPSNHYHVVDPSSLGLLSRFLGLAELDEVAHDTISAFLSLLRRAEPVVVAPPGDAPQPWLKPHTIDGRVSLAGSIIDGSLWDRLSMLEPKHHNTGELLSHAWSFQHITPTPCRRARGCEVF